MSIEFDPEKRLINLDKHGLDLAHAARVFDGATLTVEDDRFDYGETRYITIGRLNRRMVIVVWTERGESRRIISMRKATIHEREIYGARF